MANITRNSRARLLVCVLLASFSSAAQAKMITTWDFTQGVHGWVGNPFVKDLAVSSEGLAFTSTGIDPWIESRPVDLSGSDLTRITVRMKSMADSGGELFYGPHFEAGRSVRFTVWPDGQWHDYPVVIREPLGSAVRFRLDPATGPGPIVVQSIRVDSLARPVLPAWAKPERPMAGMEAASVVRSNDLVLEHFQGRWGDFVVKVAGRETAAGYASELIGVMFGEHTQWLGLENATFTVDASQGAVVCRATVSDSEGGRWQVKRRFTAGRVDGTIGVETEFVVDQDRQVIHLPWLTLLPGLGTFGTHKTQGVFAGLEYLSDEASSSEADITTAEHVRRVPDPVKITFPLMAIAHGGHYLGLTWEPSESIAAMFDSPDTIYGSQAHVMALVGPGVGENRYENDLVAHTPVTLIANRPITAQATLIAGLGRTIVPAVQKYVQIKGLPAVPEFEGGFDAAVTVLSHGWLDSALNENGRFRHAVWGSSFGAQPAADAPMYMDWLASHVADQNLKERLNQGRDLALTHLPAGGPYLSTVSHVRTPAPPLVLGGVVDYVRARHTEAMNLLTQFDDQGIKHYQPGEEDYAKTHFADHANGLAAGSVTRILEAATLSADPQLIGQGLALLDKQTTLYAGTVPRGAQTWEVPLHTPDILASAYMVKAYVLGYVISERPEYLEQARYWAWTGVPFIYLANPTDGAVGPYATIAVLGGTNWKAPIWFGLPVQWCGLVYASALHELSRHDPDGPWSQIAKGITAAGLQMTWPVTDEERQGLLPDFFHLRAQVSDGPAINPGTVQAHVPELFEKGRLYEVRKLGGWNWFIHAPCAISDISVRAGSVTFVADGWGAWPYTVLISGVTKMPAAVSPDAGVRFDARRKLLTIPLSGPSRIEISD